LGLGTNNTFIDIE